MPQIQFKHNAEMTSFFPTKRDHTRRHCHRRWLASITAPSERDSVKGGEVGKVKGDGVVTEVGKVFGYVNDYCVGDVRKIELLRLAASFQDHS